MDETAIKDGFRSVEQALRYFEIMLTRASLQPNGKASSIVALCHCHRELAGIVEAYRETVDAL